jgi:hypothetical protein|tara:strand:+ start:1020 stop:1160 length:141 start_codon:yes stop_codon:yes gene_type:complete
MMMIAFARKMYVIATRKAIVLSIGVVVLLLFVRANSFEKKLKQTRP